MRATGKVLAAAALACALVVSGLTLAWAGRSDPMPRPSAPAARARPAARQGPVAVATNVRHRPTPRGLAGGISVAFTSDTPEDAAGCVEDRVVRVFRPSSHSDTQVAQAVTDFGGRWAVTVPHSPHNYVVVAETSFADRYGRVIDCRAAISPGRTIKLSSAETDVLAHHGFAPVGQD